MSIYVLPSLFGLGLKLYILMLAAKGGRVSTVFLSLIAIFALHNAIELLGYLQFEDNQAVGLFFRPYYVVTTYLLMYLLLHGLAISGLENKYSTPALVVAATALSLLLLTTDSIVAGYYSIGYAVTAVEGHYYWVFALYLFIVLAANVAALIYGYKTSKSELKAIRCTYSLFAITPVMIAALLVVSFKLTGVGINAAGIAPIATSLFLYLVLRSESTHKLSDLRRLLPFSLERKTSNQFMHLLDGYVNTEQRGNAYKELRAGVEREIIFYSLKKCDNNITKASEMMGLENRSTLYSMMRRLDIDVQELKGNKETN